MRIAAYALFLSFILCVVIITAAFTYDTLGVALAASPEEEAEIIYAYELCYKEVGDAMKCGLTQAQYDSLLP